MNKTVVTSLLNEVVEDKEIVEIKMTVDEYFAVEKAVNFISQYLSEYRDIEESKGKVIDITQSIFIESLISASWVLNDVTW